MPRPGAVLPALLAATPAWAEVCDKERPGWDPALGAVTGMDELVGFIGSPAGFVLLGLGVVALMRPWRWPALAVVVIGLALTQWWVGQQAGLFGDGTFGAAMVEGCIGHPSLKVGFVTVFALVVFLWSERQRRRKDG